MAAATAIRTRRFVTMDPPGYDGARPPVVYGPRRPTVQLDSAKGSPPPEPTVQVAPAHLRVVSPELHTAGELSSQRVGRERETASDD
jgi:hypothetical protein